MSDVTRILNAIERGDAKATDELLPLVYEELRRLATQSCPMNRDTTRDASEIWWVREGKDYPHLWWELIPDNRSASVRPPSQGVVRRTATKCRSFTPPRHPPRFLSALHRELAQFHGMGCAVVSSMSFSALSFWPS